MTKNNKIKKKINTENAEGDYPKNDSLGNRRLVTHALPKVELDRLEKAKHYWANRDDIDQVTISVDWCRSVYQSEIGGFSYDGPKVNWNDCYVYNHSLSVDIEGKITEKDFIRLSALTKYNSEEFAYNETLIDVFHENKGLIFTILRYGSLYGPRSQPWNGVKKLVKEMIDNKKILFNGTGKEKREYIHVKDAAKMSVDLLDKSYLQKAVTLTGLQVLTQEELLEMIVEIMDEDVEVGFTGESVAYNHYNITPYQYTPKSSLKLVSNEYIDLGQGILELVSEISSDKSE